MNIVIISLIVGFLSLFFSIFLPLFLHDKSNKYIDKISLIITDSIFNQSFKSYTLDKQIIEILNKYKESTGQDIKFRNLIEFLIKLDKTIKTEDIKTELMKMRDKKILKFRWSRLYHNTIITLTNL